MHRVIANAIEAGSIICVEELPRGSRYVPPALAIDRCRQGELNGLYFCCQNSFPSFLFNDLDKLPNKRKQALAWLNKTGTLIHASGKRARKDDLLGLVMEQFGLTKSAAKNLYSDASFDGKSTDGRITVEKQISIQEIKDLKPTPSRM